MAELADNWHGENRKNVFGKYFLILKKKNLYLMFK
jgi:hypothetical protein